jgi:tripartite-type tricarboxylate transporter receptor subunit TctC
MTNSRHLPSLMAGLALLLGGLNGALAQGYPSRPITLVVPFSAGGATDVVARLLSNELASTLGKPVVIDNRAGAAGAIGANYVARSAPDGYTLCLCGGGPMVLLKILQKKLPYDPDKDFAPVTLSHLVEFVLGVPVDSPYRTLQQFVAAAKAAPGKFSYASTGAGGPAHLGQEYFDRLAGIEVTPVPYKGESAVLPDHMSGQVTLGIFSAQFGEQLSQSGHTRLIAAWSAQRLPRLPSLPTVAEQGYAGFSAGTFVGITAPKGTPPAVIETLNAAFVKAIHKPEVRDRMLELGFTPVGSSPAEFSSFLQREESKWGKVIDDLGLRGSM